ncbi:endonuclease/exonuclease/phosphatase family protein, partial [Kineococcus indalonis]|uniref:endonuclease/exonuclease/phosphatase family protein n=1 Tax=Kineococcus indalonis TaxID=2696566 RepID=UPI0014131BE9
LWPVHRARRPRSRAADAATAVVTLGVAAGAVVVAAPHAVDLSGHRPFVWAVPFRVPLGVGLAVAAGATGLAGRRWPRALPAAAALAVVAAASLVVTAQRGLGAGELPAARPGDVTFLAANVLHAGADRDAVAALAVDTGAQAVSLPESTPEYARDVAGRISAATGTGVQVFFTADADDPREGTALLVSDALGEYRQTQELTGGKGVATAVPVSGEGPPLAAVHTSAPVHGLLAEWAREVPAVARWCAEHPGALAAGDFNATVDHPGLADLPGGCVDAGSAGGTGARGTWPANVPAVLGATIDHALGDGAAWSVVGTSVRQVRGSDHRALVARWRPTGA